MVYLTQFEKDARKNMGMDLNIVEEDILFRTAYVFRSVRGWGC